jgi:D-galactonate transporter
MESSVINTLTRRLVPFLFLLYIVAYLDRINVGFAALQMQKQLGFDDAVYGLGAGMFFAGYFCFQVPSNLVLERVGARRWIAFLMVAWGIVSASMSLVHTTRGFYTVRFLLGLAEAGFFPGVILYLKHWFPAGARARTVARFMTAGPLSGVIGGPVSGALLGLDRIAGLAGWQWLFLLEGAPAVLLGTVVWFYLTDHPPEATWLTPQQREWLISELEKESAGAVGQKPHPPDRSNRALVLSVFASWPVWLLALVYFGLNTVSYGISLWLPTLIRSLSVSNSFTIGLISAIPYVVAAVVMVRVGLHSDRTGERRWHVALPAFAGAAALLLAAFSTSITPAIAGISIAVMGVFAMCGPFWAMPSTILSGAAAAAGIAFINSIGNLGGFFGPYILGSLRHSTGDFKAGLLTIGAGLAMSGAIALRVRTESP